MPSHIVISVNAIISPTELSTPNMGSTMGIITDTMPLIASQAGVWEGNYLHLDANNKEIDRHQSRLVCRLFDNNKGRNKNEARITQSNIYTWSDGTQEIRYFEAFLAGNRFVLKNDLIDGWMATLDQDTNTCQTGSTIFVQWTRPSEPGFHYYEMITVADDGLSKNRTWHWYRNNELFQRTVVNERRISHTWDEQDDPSYFQYRPRS